MKAFWQYFACEVMGWHAHPRVMTFPGEGYCPRCGEFVIAGQNGRWFSLRD